MAESHIEIPVAKTGIGWPRAPEIAGSTAERCSAPPRSPIFADLPSPYRAGEVMESSSCICGTSILMSSIQSPRRVRSRHIGIVWTFTEREIITLSAGPHALRCMEFDITGW